MQAIIIDSLVDPETLEWVKRSDVRNILMSHAVLRPDLREEIKAMAIAMGFLDFDPTPLIREEYQRKLKDEV